MTIHTYRYKLRGLTSEFISDQCGGTPPTSVGLVIPTCSQDVSYDDAYHADVLYAAQAAGYELLETDPPANTAVALAQVKSAKLASNSSSIGVGAGWTDVTGLSVVMSTKGNTVFGVVMSAILDSLVLSTNCEARVLINGGAFSDTLVGDASFQAVAGGGATFTTTVDIPSTGSRTDYTLRIQARTTTALSSIVLRALSGSITVFEYSQ